MPRSNQPFLSLCRQLSSHHSPSPTRSTASHCGPVSQIVSMGSPADADERHLTVRQLNPVRQTARQTVRQTAAPPHSSPFHHSPVINPQPIPVLTETHQRGAGLRSRS
ncbi:hypothetical protein GCM10010508_40890 [Streptomyces naganishii JCM 4654]|uniref:Uncharacterized protein n=1 Tax=Streptomyces naganishii JCM 4654 TaxID=1306179 RepID=A0A918Y5N2_9ACTN|nr:hypothetical protein GCM10010508_40890 [Streptomyces naganishii JCM 4654]